MISYDSADKLTSAALVTRPAGNSIALSRHVDRGPLLLLVIELLIERDGLVLVEGLESFLVDGREMHKYILGSIVGSDCVAIDDNTKVRTVSPAQIKN